MQKIIAIVGPTASGKTDLSVAVASHFKGEIISADSMQIYREMNIGTAKPSKEEQKGIPHHLMGHVSVEDTYNVSSFVQDAGDVLNHLKKEGSLPVICGGTGLYIDHLLGNTDFFDIPLNEAVRVKYQEMAKRDGNEVLYQLLKEKDPVLAEKLHFNDTKRVIRGLEVLEITGKRLSEFQQQSHREAPYRVLWIGLNYRNRQILYDRINLRVDLMIEKGLMEEIHYLTKHHRLSSTARAAIGYKEIIDAVECGGSIEAAVELVKQKSRNYAKRQLTWFGKSPQIHWFYRDELTNEALREQVFKVVSEFLEGGNE